VEVSRKFYKVPESSKWMQQVPEIEGSEVSGRFQLFGPKSKVSLFHKPSPL